MLTVTVPANSRLSALPESTAIQGPAAWTIAVNENGVTVSDSDGKELLHGTALRVCADDGDPTTIAFGKSKRRYRGALEFTTQKGSAALLVVNELPVETYLRGVIAAEMPPSAPPDALKAQTIAARSYALKNRGRYRSRRYDLSDNTDCQVYGGADAEKPATDAAVRDTAGLVLVKDGALVLADYYDDCGGITSPGDRESDYPPSVRDAEEADGPDYCARGLYHTWSVKLTAEELSNTFSSAETGIITNIRVEETDKSGRTRSLEIVGERGSKKLSGSAFRGRIGYSRLKSTLFSISREDNGGFVVSGKGYGHGQGLCQMGAMGMASAPYNHTCDEILNHYYPGSEVVKFSDQEASPQPDPEARGKLPSRGSKKRQRLSSWVTLQWRARLKS
jgi:stage II sporulation protein D